MTAPPTDRIRRMPWERPASVDPHHARTRIVVVCAANRARSPLVERLLQAELDARDPGRFAVSSSGTQVLDRREMAEGTRRLLRARGIDDAGHRATPLHATHLDGAALVLVAEEAHALAVLDRAPALLNRTFTVLELAAIARLHAARALDPAGFTARAGTLRAVARESVGALDLLDPVGDDPVAFTALEAQLGSAVKDIATALVASRG